jgi:hypothetical protein
MKKNKYPRNHTASGNGAMEQTSSTAELSESRSDFSSSGEELARRAYFIYMNQGSLPGHDVQHWLEAEAALLAERNLTRIHGFEHRPN